jgi:hypothetical protein
VGRIAIVICDVLCVDERPRTLGVTLLIRRAGFESLAAHFPVAHFPRPLPGESSHHLVNIQVANRRQFVMIL